MPLSKEKQKQYDADYYQKNKESKKIESARRYVDNKEKIKERQRNYHEDIKQHAENSIVSGSIINQHKWNLWCDMIKRSARNNNRQYSNEFTSDIMSCDFYDEYKDADMYITKTMYIGFEHFYVNE